MTFTDHYESKLWKIIEKEGLADLSQFHRFGFFDEVPLYSRLSQVSFLRDLSRDRADGTLLEFALKFLKALIWYETPLWPFLASVTVWNDSEEELIVPNLFVCSGKVEELNGERLELHQPKKSASKRIRTLVKRLHMMESLEVLEDSSTLPDMTRSFVGYMVPPYPNVVPLHWFVRDSARTIRAIPGQAVRSLRVREPEKPKANKPSRIP
jgi:Immunity protein 15